jgi:hypothetical protein
VVCHIHLPLTALATKPSMTAPWLDAPACILRFVNAARVVARTSTLMYTILAGRPSRDRTADALGALDWALFADLARAAFDPFAMLTSACCGERSYYQTVQSRKLARVAR